MASLRKGSVMLMLLVMVIIGGILAMRLLPDVEIIERRQSDVQLGLYLGQIRQALDIKRTIDPDYNPLPENPTIADISNMLDQLVTDKLLAANLLKDSTIPSHLWESELSFYWVPSTNIASNTSFEVSDSDPTFVSQFWKQGTTTQAESDFGFFLDHPSLNDYPGQNKLGNVLSTIGTSIKIVK